MSGLTSSRAGTVAITFAAWGAALLIKILAGPAILPSIFIPFYGAVVLSAWVGGLGCGLLATFLAALTGLLLYLPPLWPVSSDTWLTATRLGLFIVTAAAISAVTAARRKTLRD